VAMFVQIISAETPLPQIQRKCEHAESLIDALSLTFSIRGVLDR
jgi:hypothetical protein